MNKKICVYTCITGNYDNLKEPNIVEQNIDYYCFTNNKNLKSNIWKIIYIEDFNLNNIKLARRTKILGHEEINDKYDIYVWVDADMTIYKSINDFIKEYCDLEKYDFVSFKHFCRNSIKEEMKACVYYGKETIDKVKKLEEFYKENNFKDDTGLIESTIIVKKNTKTVKETMKLWFDMIKNYSHRDQLSFNYVITVTNLKFNLINLNVWDNEWFRVTPHNKDNKKYSIHFKINENETLKEFKYNDIIYKDCEIKNNILEIETIIPKKCNIIEIDLSCLNNKLLKNIDTEYEYKLENFEKYNDKYICIKEKGILKLYSNFKKNDKIVIKLEIGIKSTEELVIDIKNIINDLNQELQKKNNEIIELNNQINILNNKYNNIINSKRWKFIDKMGNIKSKITK